MAVLSTICHITSIRWERNLLEIIHEASIYLTNQLRSLDILTIVTNDSTPFNIKVEIFPVRSDADDARSFALSLTRHNFFMNSQYGIVSICWLHEEDVLIVFSERLFNTCVVELTDNGKLTLWMVNLPIASSPFLSWRVTYNWRINWRITYYWRINWRIANNWRITYNWRFNWRIFFSWSSLILRSWTAYQNIYTDVRRIATQLNGWFLWRSYIVSNTLRRILCYRSLFLQMEMFLEEINHVTMLKHRSQSGVSRCWIGIAHSTTKSLYGSIGYRFVFVFRIADLWIDEHHTYHLIELLIVIEVVVEHHFYIRTREEREPWVAQVYPIHDTTTLVTVERQFFRFPLLDGIFPSGTRSMSDVSFREFSAKLLAHPVFQRCP